MKKQKQEVMGQLELFPDVRPDVVDKRVKLSEIQAVMDGPPPGADLVASVERLGVLLPPILMEGQNGLYHVVDGRRRVMAARRAGIDEIMARVLPNGDYADVITIQTNQARRPNPVSEFYAIRNLMERGFTLSEIGRELGLKASVVKARLRLNDLVEELLGLMATGRISTGVAESLSKMPESLQRKAVKVFEDTDSITGRDVAKLKEAKAAELTSLMGVLFSGQESKAATTIRSFKAAVTAVEEAGVAAVTINGQRVAVADIAEAFAAEIKAKEETNE